MRQSQVICRHLIAFSDVISIESSSFNYLSSNSFCCKVMNQMIFRSVSQIFDQIVRLSKHFFLQMLLFDHMNIYRILLNLDLSFCQNLTKLKFRVFCKILKFLKLDLLVLCQDFTSYPMFNYHA